MITFDKHIQSSEKEDVAGYDLIWRFVIRLFDSSIRLEICGKIRFFRLYSYFLFKGKAI